jgi:hypothetical protein
MRLLATVGIFKERANGNFALNSLGELLPHWSSGLGDR